MDYLGYQCLATAVNSIYYSIIYLTILLSIVYKRKKILKTYTILLIKLKDVINSTHFANVLSTA